MNEYERNLDFEATIKMARDVALYFGENKRANLEWWNTPQDGLDGCTPYMVAMEMHGQRITEFCNIIRNKLLIDEDK